MSRISLKNVLIISRLTCKIVSRKKCIHREYESKSSQFSYTFIVVARTMKFLAVVTPPYIYRGYSTQKTSWEEKFTPMNMRSCGCRHFRKHKETKNSEKYIFLDIYLKLYFLYKREVTSSGSRYYV